MVFRRRVLEPACLSLLLPGVGWAEQAHPIVANGTRSLEEADQTSGEGIPKPTEYRNGNGACQWRME